MEAKKMHLCNIPKERPSVDREMNRCLCWIWGACALYEHGFIWIFSLEMDQHLHLVRLEFLLAVVHVENVPLVPPLGVDSLGQPWLGYQ